MQNSTLYCLFKTQTTFSLSFPAYSQTKTSVWWACGLGLHRTTYLMAKLCFPPTVCPVVSEWRAALWQYPAADVCSPLLSCGWSECSLLHASLFCCYSFALRWPFTLFHCSLLHPSLHTDSLHMKLFWFDLVVTCSKFHFFTVFVFYLLQVDLLKEKLPAQLWTVLEDKAGVILWVSYCQQIPWKDQSQQCVCLTPLPPRPLWLSAPSQLAPTKDKKRQVIS